jgi:hypothetical protein
MARRNKDWRDTVRRDKNLVRHGSACGATETQQVCNSENSKNERQQQKRTQHTKYNNNSPGGGKNYFVVLACGADDGVVGGAGLVANSAILRERYRYAVIRWRG